MSLVLGFNDSSIINGITLQGTNTGGYGGYLGWKDSWSGDSYNGYRAAILGDVPSANDGRLGFHVAKGGSLTQSVKIDTDRQIIHTCDAGGVFSIHTTNDGNNSNRYGILVQSGADDASGTTTTFTAVPAGTTLPIRVRKVRTVGTANSVVGLY